MLTSSGLRDGVVVPSAQRRRGSMARAYRPTAPARRTASAKTTDLPNEACRRLVCRLTKPDTYVVAGADCPHQFSVFALLAGSRGSRRFVLDQRRHGHG